MCVRMRKTIFQKYPLVHSFASSAYWGIPARTKGRVEINSESSSSASTSSNTVQGRIPSLLWLWVNLVCAINRMKMPKEKNNKSANDRLRATNGLSQVILLVSNAVVVLYTFSVQRGWNHCMLAAQGLFTLDTKHTVPSVAAVKGPSFGHSLCPRH